MVRISEVLSFIHNIFNGDSLYIYGAGSISKSLLKILPNEYHNYIKGIVVTVNKERMQSICGFRIFELSQINDKGASYLLALGSANYKDIIPLLDKAGAGRIIEIPDDVASKIEFLAKYDISSLWKRYINIDEVDFENLYNNKQLNIGSLLKSINVLQISISRWCHSWGGSDVLDYMLLKCLAIKYKLKTYLEIGTYVGQSLDVMSEVVERCYSITVPKEHPAHMKNWCRERHCIDYSNTLVDKDNEIQYQIDSAEFDYDIIPEKIDLFFIDGNHSYNGVWIDSFKIFENIDLKDTFVVWHDVRTPQGLEKDVVYAIYDAIGSDNFDNFYCFNDSMCGIYIPCKYLNDFEKALENDELDVYELSLKII